MSSKTIIVGARGSALSTWQATWVCRTLKEKAPQFDYEFQAIKTKGDKILDSPLAKIGDKGLFVREIEQALYDGSIHLAVHSLKDLPTEMPDGLILAAVGKREDYRDVLVSNDGIRFADLPAGARIGTSSLRRTAQILHHRPDLKILDIRGNLDTRLKKAKDGEYDAIVLAAAGIRRMERAEEITEYFEPEFIIPAVSQGCIGIESREDDEEIRGLVNLINDRASELAARAERAYMRVLEGGCQVPIGALAEVQGNNINIRGMVASLDGSRLLKDVVSAEAAEPEKAGAELAEKLKAQGAVELLAEIRAE